MVRSDGNNTMTLNEFMGSYALCQSEYELKKQKILGVFEGYIAPVGFDRWHLGLYRFSSDKPLVYFNHVVVDETLAYLRQNCEHTLNGMRVFSGNISHAFDAMLRPGPSWGRERRLSIDRPDELAEYESLWHPEYVRYCEHIWNHLVKLPLYILGAPKQKNYWALALGLRADKLREHGLASLASGFDVVVRNAISHGGTRFEVAWVRYSDRTDEVILSPDEFAKTFDNLVDTCHSIAIALLLFLCEHRQLVESHGIGSIPTGVRFLFVEAFSSHPGFSPVIMMDSTSARTNSQLNLVCSIASRSRQVQLLEGVRVCWHACVFGGDGYDRYVVSFDCGMRTLSMIILNGERLFRASRDHEPIEQCLSEILETPLLWFDRPKLARLHYYGKCLARSHWEMAKQRIVYDWRRIGVSVPRPLYTLVGVLNKSAAKMRRLEAHLVITEGSELSEPQMLSVVLHALRRLRRRGVRRIGIAGERGIPKPPDQIWLRVYSRSRRLRTLMSYGWKDTELLLMAEWARDPGRTKPFFTQDADIVIGRMRIKRNPSVRPSAP